MTVDSELRKIWRKDIAELVEIIVDLKNQIHRLELEVAIHHPKVDLPPVADHQDEQPPT